MRYVIYGAGAIGGSLGAKLFAAGRDVVLICRALTYAVRPGDTPPPDGEATTESPRPAP